MPSKKRYFVYGTYHHVFNRGVLKKKIFHEEYDYKVFIGKMIKYSKKYPVGMVIYCIMPNHFHFLMREIGKSKPYIPMFMRQVQSTYALYYKSKYGHPGRLFQGTFKNKLMLTDMQFYNTMRYIKINPVKDGLVVEDKDWKYMYINKKYLKGIP